MYNVPMAHALEGSQFQYQLEGTLCKQEGQETVLLSTVKLYYSLITTNWQLIKAEDALVNTISSAM